MAQADRKRASMRPWPRSSWPAARATVQTSWPGCSSWPGSLTCTAGGRHHGLDRSRIWPGNCGGCTSVTLKPMSRQTVNHIHAPPANAVGKRLAWSAEFTATAT